VTRSQAIPRRSGERAWLVLVAAAALGCETPIPDPPPKASPAEIPVAPSGALGALAAGTDGAPKLQPQPEGLAPVPPPEGFAPGPLELPPSATPPPASSGGEGVTL
jgi:hypothetical protein